MDEFELLQPKDPNEPAWEMTQEITAYRLHHGTQQTDSGALEPVVLIELQIRDANDPIDVQRHARILCKQALAFQLAESFGQLARSWEPFAPMFRPPKEGGPVQ